MNIRTCLLPVVLLCASPLLRAQDNTVHFDGTDYQLAAASVAADGVVTNEYVKEGESMDAWTTRLTVRHHPNAQDIGAAINPWLQSVRQQLTRKWVPSKTPEARSEQDVIIEAWLMSADRTALEATLRRFVVESGQEGVTSYCYTEKLSPDNAEANAAFHRRKFVRCEGLARLNVPLKREK